MASLSPATAGARAATHFVHIKDLRLSGIDSAEVGDAFCYALEKRPDGKVGAVNLEKMEKVRG